MQRLVTMRRGPPGAIAIVQRGSKRTVFRAGVADRSRRTPLRRTDHMRMASTSKAFNGAVVLALVDQGTLSLDDTIAQRLPNLPADWGPVTLRQLLDHTSGLPDFSATPAYQDTLRSDSRTLFLPHGSLLSFVAADPLQFPPGSQYRYSNSDNIVAALMAEQATGQLYEALLSRSCSRPSASTRPRFPTASTWARPTSTGTTTRATRPRT
jgi:D-alanyl-D-alanine carboxypeptidase